MNIVSEYLLKKFEVAWKNNVLAVETWAWMGGALHVGYGRGLLVVKMHKSKGENMEEQRIAEALDMC